MLRKRYPAIRIDISGLDAAPLIDLYCLEPERVGDGADLVGIMAGEQVRIRSVQALDDEVGWAWSYGTGLVRLGRALDRVLDRMVEL